MIKELKKITMTGTKYELLNELINMCGINLCNLNDANWNKIISSVVSEYEAEELFSKEEILGAAMLVATSEELFKCAKDVMKWELVEPAKENAK